MRINEGLFGKKNDNDQRRARDINMPIRYHFSKEGIDGPFELYCGENINLGVPDEVLYELDNPHDLLSLSGTLIFYNKKIRTCERQWYIHYNYNGTRYRNKIILREIEGGIVRFIPQKLEKIGVSDSFFFIK
ncbi:MAG: hypothetical protein ABSE07_06895 [Methanoregula sp.]|jgi:hypothetical protein